MLGLILSLIMTLTWVSMMYCIVLNINDRLTPTYVALGAGSGIIFLIALTIYSGERSGVSALSTVVSIGALLITYAVCYLMCRRG